MANKNNPVAVCPWPGLASYEDPARAETVRLFCGRDKDSEQLSYQIDRELYVTLYGRSGIGKTSLINAGVFPRLRESGYLPLSLRLGRLDEACSYQSFLLSSLEQELAAAGCRTEVIDVVAPQEDESATDYLWNYFARHRFFSADGAPRFPVFVFDQFEEVFSSRPAAAAVLLRQIHYITDETHEISEAHVGGEKYEYDYNFRFVLSIREDDLYKLESCLDTNYLQRLKANRYRLFPMSKEDAREAVLLPAGELIAESEKEPVVETILEIARDKEEGSISTNILSLVCSRIFAQMQRTGQSAITHSLVREFLAGNPFDEFYREVTAGMSSKAKSYMEEHLVDASGRRNSIPAVNFFKKVPDGERLLSGTGRILQRVQVSSEASRIELIHDSFCQPLLDQREKRLRRHRRRTAVLITAIVAVIAAIIGWIWNQNSQLKELDWKNKANQSRFVAEEGFALNDNKDSYLAMKLALEILPKDVSHPDRPLVPQAERLLRTAALDNNMSVNTHDEVSFIRISDDRQLLALGGYMGEVSLWRIADGFCMGFFHLPNEISFLSFNAEGNRLVATSTDGTVCVWHQAGDNWEQESAFDYSAVFAVFDHTGRHLITGNGRDKYIRKIEIQTGSLVDSLLLPFLDYDDDYWVPVLKDATPGRRYVYGGIFDRDDYNWSEYGLATQSDSVWFADMQTMRYKVIPGSLSSCYFSAENDLLYIDGEVCELSDLSFKPVTDSFFVNGIQYSVPISSELLSDDVYYIPALSPSAPSALFYSSAYTKKEIPSFLKDHSVSFTCKPYLAFDSYFSSFALNADGTKLYRMVENPEDHSRQVIEYDCENRLDQQRVLEFNETLYRLDGFHFPLSLAKEEDTGAFVVYDVENNRAAFELSMYDNLASSYVFDRFQTHLYIIQQEDYLSSNSILYGFDCVSGKELYRKRLAISGPFSIDASWDGSCLMVKSSDELLLLESTTGESRLKIDDLSSVDSCALSPDGKQLAMISSDSTLKLLNTYTGETNKEYRIKQDSYDCGLYYSTDNQHVLLTAEGVFSLMRLSDGEIVLSNQKVLMKRYLLHRGFSDEQVLFAEGGRKIFFLWERLPGVTVIDFPPLQELIDQTRERFKDNPLTQEERYKYYLD